MDRTLLERMVGAVVLVLLLVLLAPALLDGSADNAAKRDNLPVPDSGKRTEVIILNAPVTAPPPPAAEQRKPVSAAASQPVPAPEPKPAPKPEPKPATKPAPAPVAKASVSAGNQPPQGFAVQLGSFSEQANATRFATRITGAGFKAFVVRSAAGSGSIYRVYSGPEANREAADKLAGRLKSAGYSVLVVDLGGASGG